MDVCKNEIAVWKNFHLNTNINERLLGWKNPSVLSLYPKGNTAICSAVSAKFEFSLLRVPHLTCYLTAFREAASWYGSSRSGTREQV